MAAPAMDMMPDYGYYYGGYYNGYYNGGNYD
jgi:hypothetical protein